MPVPFVAVTDSVFPNLDAARRVLSQIGVNRPQTRLTGRFNGLLRLVFRHGLRRAEAYAGKPAEAG